MTHYAWPEIESFHNIRKYVRAYPDITQEPFIIYWGKVKLHGTNAAIQVHEDGQIIAQSRSNVITTESDNAGFARWVKENEEQWRHFPLKNVVVFGEWCGKGIQGGVAISAIEKKVFAVFAIKEMDSDNVIIDPDVIAPYVMSAGVKETYVLPWHGQPVTIDWKAENEVLERNVTEINDVVMTVEQNDPWVEAVFGVKGTGEGIVYYPIAESNIQKWELMSNLMFKAKGEKHKNVKTAAPAQVNPVAAASVVAFVDMVLTEARLEQGAKTVGEVCDVKLTGKFIAWISGDVAKETADELEASNLTLKQVQGPLVAKARAWYMEQTKKL